MSVKITGSSQKAPKQWKKFLSDGQNKTTLVEFLVGEWSSGKYTHRLEERVLYITNGSNCFRLSVENGRTIKETVNALSCTHEEADTRMLLHAKRRSNQGHQIIVLNSPNVDLLACHFKNR